ncbi:GlsB/YeaQ/YmgE family stress response membrane protein [Candidatus Pacearchaeota archaeon]|nr:GlsB/YeaQ/YmgE family stress response membrane protein [Candidatus Pacearchaeota archaeon]
MDIFFWIILGAVAGFFTSSVFLPKPGVNLFTEILGGVVGAILGRVIAVPLAGGFNVLSLVLIVVFIGVGIGVSRLLRI